MNDATHSPSAGCRVVQGGETTIGVQGLLYSVGISAETAGARGLHLQMVTIPPGGRAKAHKHAAHETAIYAVSGTSHCWHGHNLEHHAIVRPGDYFYIPADMPHLPYNPSSTTPCVALIARTDANEQESVVLLPELETHAVQS